MDEAAGRLLQLIWLMLPAYCANMAPPFVRFWRGWNRPINRRLLGSHKTIVGFGLGVVVALVVAFLQVRLNSSVPILWEGEKWLWFGLVAGIGALGGDALKSLFKRRLGIPPGSAWIPADQLDFVIGALLLILPFVSLTVFDLAFIIAFTFIADIAVNQISFRLGIRETAW